MLSLPRSLEPMVTEVEPRVFGCRSANCASFRFAFATREFPRNSQADQSENIFAHNKKSKTKAFRQVCVRCFVASIGERAFAYFWHIAYRHFCAKSQKLSWRRVLSLWGDLKNRQTRGS